MNIKLFCHSLVSDWNHGNAHFLRGVMRELAARGHDIDVLEPGNGWSRSNLMAEAGQQAVDDFTAAFPDLPSRTYDLQSLDVGRELADADLVLVHDWNEPWLVAAIGAHRRRHGGYVLLFYDAHHRAASSPGQIDALDLSGYDAVLVFGAVLREVYLERGWATRVYVWHEAADTSVFKPLDDIAKTGELVWVGNWGDGERGAELREFLLEPARRLGLSGHIYGVRYPPSVRSDVRAAGLNYRGWIANHQVPRAFAQHRVTVHVPRRAYVRRVPGVPTIRVFEALACGIPLVSAPWQDTEGLFRAGEDYLIAHDGTEMTMHLKALLHDPEAAGRLAASGLETIRARHTCAHRVDELLAIRDQLVTSREELV
jgi:spore maturation protein CgeB